MSFDALILIQLFFFLYFIGLNIAYLGLNFCSLAMLRRYLRQRSLSILPHVYLGLEPPISILVPAYNEAVTIEASIRSLLQLQYPEYEIVVINDGSKDNTLDVLIRQFSLRPFPEALHLRLATKPIREIYRSTVYPNLRIVDKENGGKADSLQAGINLARSPLFCAVDADSILQRDSLHCLVQPFLEDPTTVACGGIIRIANGCTIKSGYLVNAGLPRNLLALFQIVEYFRAFLFGRMGWAPLNAMLIISGAFGLFHKETAIAAGGYRTDTVGEDMELVVRLHRYLRLKRQPYQIAFVPNAVCWTEAPEDLRTLRNQRVRWQRGLCESLYLNRGLLFHPWGGSVGWLAFPFMLVFEALGPLIEVAGYIFMGTAFIQGGISGEAFAMFLLLAIGLGLLLSFNALLLEELTFHLYTKPRQILVLFLGILLENIGYRQLNSIWRLIGVWRWLSRGKASWGEMKRRGTGR